MKVQFIGDGGHAGNIKHGLEIVEQSENKILAFCGLDCEALERRVTQRPDGVYPNLIASASTGCPERERQQARQQGIQIMAGAIIMNNVTLGDFCIINTGAIIEHDSVIGKGTHIAPGAVVLGNVKIGDYCFIGANATIIQGTVVPDRTFVKAGSIWNNR